MLLFFFILGLSIGSFLNVLIDRFPRNEKITGRSYCESCKKTLSWKDLVPVLSFIYLKGKCRYCKAKLSYQYPIVELITGVLFASTFILISSGTIFNFQFSIFNEFSIFNFQLIYYLFIISCFIVIFFADLKYGIIPDKIVFPAIVVSLVYLTISTFYPPPATQDSLLALRAGQSLIVIHTLSAIGAFIFFLFIYLITKSRGMGFGDVKLSFLLGLILGFPAVVLALYIAFLTGGALGIILILWKKKTLTSAVAFGPFLAFGALLSLFFHAQIIHVVLGSP